MKVLQINNCYPNGSTGKIVRDLEECLASLGHEFIIVYGNGPKTDNNHYKVCSYFYKKIQALRSRISGIMYGGCFLSTRKVIKIIKTTKPDIVHLHCLNSHFINIFTIVKWLKEHHICTVVTNHAEFLYTANCGHAFDCQKYLTGCGFCPMLKLATKSWFRDGTHESWIKMNKAFKGFKRLLVVNVSPWLNQRSSNSSILSSFENKTILNGVNTKIFHYRKQLLHRKEKVILHVTANFSDDSNDLKGGRFLIQLSNKFVGQNVKIFVAGNYTINKIVPSNIVLLGNISDQIQLAQLYSNADLVVLTSRRETFSMVTAESLCCGTPVVGFKAGGPESIALSSYCEFVDFGDIDSLYNSVNKCLNNNYDKELISREAQKIFCREEMANKYLDAYKYILNN